MKKLLQFLMTMFLSVAMVGCYLTEEPVGPDVPVVGSLKLSQEEMTVGAEGGEFSVDIFTEYAYETTTNVDWITISGGSCGTEYCTLYFTVAKNDTTSEREGVITVFCDDFNLTATLTVTQEAGENTGNTIPNNEIWYTSSDGAVVEPYATDVFGANIVSNTYENGQGVITFDGDVTQIGAYAFYVNEREPGTTGGRCLTSITIPNSVTEIGEYAFAYCPLADVAMPNGVTKIGPLAFGVCRSLTNIVIPNSVTHIEERAFISCYGLTEVTIPESVTYIGKRAFSYCCSLTAFYGKYASDDNRCLIVDGVLNFFAPAGVTEYTIPNGVKVIGRAAFAWSSNMIENSVLESVTIPNSVTEIGEDTFYKCTSLKEVYCKPITPPTAVSDWSWNAFDSNASDRKIYVPRNSVEAYKAAIGWSDYAADMVCYDFEKGEVIKISSEIRYTSSDGAIVEPYATDVFGANIVSNTYENGQGVITFDNEVTRIGERAFYQCTKLTSITIPDNVTYIGTRAFQNCTALTSITIPNSVTSIGNHAFISCTSLTSITIPDSVTSIMESAFYSCTSLTSVTIPNSVTKIDGMAFVKCTSLKAFYGKFASADNRCLVDNGKLVVYANKSGSEYTIPNSITEIGDYAFWGCTNLKKVTIPNTITTIGNFAFDACRNIEAVYITDLAKWCEISFGRASSNPLHFTVNLYLNGELVTDLVIPNGVTSIGKYAFYGYNSLTSVTIPDSVTTIGTDAFYYCTSLTEVNCKPTVPPTGGSHMFSYYSSGYKPIGCKIYVPAASVEAYKAAQYWSEYADYIVGFDF